MLFSVMWRGDRYRVECLLLTLAFACFVVMTLSVSAEIRGVAHAAPSNKVVDEKECEVRSPAAPRAKRFTRRKTGRVLHVESFLCPSCSGCPRDSDDSEGELRAIAMCASWLRIGYETTNKPLRYYLIWSAHLGPCAPRAALSSACWRHDASDNSTSHCSSLGAAGGWILLPPLHTERGRRPIHHASTSSDPVEGGRPKLAAIYDRPHCRGMHGHSYRHKSYERMLLVQKDT